MGRALIVGIVWVLLAGIPAAQAQSSIELRPSARIARGVPVTLAQIARLDGADAVALAGITIVEAGKAGPTISVEEVRRVIDAQGKVNWGRITLRGLTCSLQAPATAPAPKKAEESRTNPPEATQNLDVIERGTVKEAVVARIAQIVQAAPEALRLTFESEDADLLALSTAGRTLEARPTAVADRLPLSITLFEGDRIVGGPKTIRVGVQVKRTVLVALAAKRRGEAIETADILTEDRWLGPTMRPAAADQAIGSAAKSRIDSGEVIMTEDVAPAVVVNKGDVVSIRCVSGTLALTTRGRALAAGRDGELVEFQAMDSKRTFFARMDGRGRAVIATGGETTEAERPRRSTERTAKATEAGRAMTASNSSGSEALR